MVRVSGELDALACRGVDMCTVALKVAVVAEVDALCRGFGGCGCGECGGAEEDDEGCSEMHGDGNGRSVQRRNGSRFRY